MGSCLSEDPDIAQAGDLNKVETEDGTTVYVSQEVVGVVWEFLEDIGSCNWVQYDEDICRQINVAYSSAAKKCQVSSKGSNASFEMDFELMIETNVVNGWQRKIRMHSADNRSRESAAALIAVEEDEPSQHHYQQQAPLPETEANAADESYESGSGSGSNSYSIKWQWFSASIGWKDYDDKLSRKIDAAYRENIARYAFKIRSNNTKYEIDFTHYKQCNLDTMKLRDVRRVDNKKNKNNKKKQQQKHQQQQQKQKHAQFVWQVYNDLNVWQEYSDNISLKLETVLEARAAVARMKMHGVEHEIRLNEMPMNQYNMETGQISRIRRVVKQQESVVDAAAVEQQRNAIKYFAATKREEKEEEDAQWMYKDEQTGWICYDAQTNIHIEHAFADKCVDTIEITRDSAIYEVRLAQQLECNFATNTMRPIKRVLPHNVGGMEDAFDALSNRLPHCQSYDDQQTLEEDTQIQATPVDSEFALKDYGNDYDEYMTKFKNLGQDFFE